MKKCLICREEFKPFVDFGRMPIANAFSTQQELKNEYFFSMRVTVWSTAYDQKRPYLDLLDASRAIAFIIKNNIFDGRIYNVLTSNCSVREVVDIIKEFVPNLEIEFVDNRIMNQLSYEVMCDRFKSKGFVSSGSMTRGVRETIDILKQSNNL